MGGTKRQYETKRKIEAKVVPLEKTCGFFLEFVAADIGSEDSITRMLLITDYHEHGSLYEYLQRGETLSVNEALHLAHRYCLTFSSL